MSETAPTDTKVKPAPPVDPVVPAEGLVEEPEQPIFPDSDKPGIVLPDEMKKNVRPCVAPESQEAHLFSRFKLRWKRLTMRGTSFHSTTNSKVTARLVPRIQISKTFHKLRTMIHTVFEPRGVTCIQITSALFCSASAPFAWHHPRLPTMAAPFSRLQLAAALLGAAPTLLQNHRTLI